MEIINETHKFMMVRSRGKQSRSYCAQRHKTIAAISFEQVAAIRSKTKK